MCPQGIRDNFHALAEHDAMASPSLQEIYAKLAEDTALRAKLNSNRFGHSRLEPLTPLLFITLLTILCLPTMMQPRAVLALFRDISAGKITDTADIRAVLVQYTHAVPDTVCEQTAEELKLVRMVLTAQKAQKKEAARRATEVVAADGSVGGLGASKDAPPALDVVPSSESAGAAAGPESPDPNKKGAQFLNFL